MNTLKSKAAGIALLFSTASFASAVQWDSRDYNLNKARQTVRYDTSKIEAVRGCSAVKVRDNWIATGKHCNSSTSRVQDGGRTFRVLKNLTNPDTDQRLLKVQGTLTGFRRHPTATNVNRGQIFKKTGRGWYGRTGDLTRRGGTWTGGRNEINGIGTDLAFCYSFNKSYEDEVTTTPGDSGGSAVVPFRLVGTTWGIRKGGLRGFCDTDWTRSERWWRGVFRNQ